MRRSLRGLRCVKTGVMIALTGFALSGCISTVSEPSRHNAPLSSAIQRKMAEKNVKPSDPIFIRIHKLESELEVWKRDSSGQYVLLETYPICRWSGQLAL